MMHLKIANSSQGHIHEYESTKRYLCFDSKGPLLNGNSITRSFKWTRT